MTTTSETLPASQPIATSLPVGTTDYAQPSTAEHRSGRRRWWGLLGVVVLGGLALGFRPASQWFDRLLGHEAFDGAVHVVQPTTLNITLTEDGELKPQESVKVKCEVEGQNKILFVVDESKRVKKGDLLVELATDQLEDRLSTKTMELDGIQANYEAAIEELEIQKSQNASSIKKAKIDFEVAELDLKKYLKGDLKGRLGDIDLKIRQAEEDIQRQDRELTENRQLLQKGWVTESEIADREFKLTVARWQLDQHKLSKKILVEFEHPKTKMQRESAVERAQEELEREKQRAISREKKSQARVRQYEAQLKNIKTACDKIRKAIEQSKMYAPADGIVQYPHSQWRWNDNRIAVGESVYKGQTLIELPDTSQMIVKTRIHEADRHLVAEGMPCVVTVPAAPGQSFAGKITKIDRFVASENRWLNPNLKEHGAEILLEPTETTLSPGESAEVKILIDTLENVLAVPVQCVFTRGSHSFVFVDRNGTPEKTEVVLGQSNTRMVEVRKGLNQGDRVLMEADEHLLALLPNIDSGDKNKVQQPKAEHQGSRKRATNSKKPHPKPEHHATPSAKTSSPTAAKN